MHVRASTSSVLAPPRQEEELVGFRLRSKRQPEEETGSGRPLSVLVAHRPCELRKRVTTLLSDAGYNVSVAGSSQETLLILNQENQPKPDVLVIEEDLPTMKAAETLEKARLTTNMRSVKIVLLTERTEGDMPNLRDLKASDILTNPTPGEVFLAVQRLGRNIN